MNWKLKKALIRRSTTTGFAMPVAIGMGLAMLLVGTTMVVRSQGDSVTASAQTATNRGLSAAETGITRYRFLIDRNRAIAIYNRVGNPGWTNPTTIPGISSSCIADPNSGPQAVLNASNNNWQNIDPNDPRKGQYRLVDYVYSTPGQRGGTGTLTVEGRVNQVGTGSAVTSGLGTATTRLQVQIRVDDHPPSGSIPGLWVDNVPQNMSANRISGNILVAGCELPSWSNSYGNDPQGSVTPGFGYTVTAHPNARLPDTPDLPRLPNGGVNLARINVVSASAIFGATLPRVNDLDSLGRPYTSGAAIAEGTRYLYLVTDNLSGSGNITLRSNANVVFHLQQNVDIGGNTNINVSGDVSNMQIYGNTFLRGANNRILRNSDNTPQTKYGCSAALLPIGDNLTEAPSNYAGACPTTTVRLRGSGHIRALVHAPDAAGAVAGGAGGCSVESNRGFVGAVWLRRWDNSLGSAAGSNMVCAAGDYGNMLAQFITPSIPFISSWERLEARND